MSDAAEQALFAAREFAARLERELGNELSPVVLDHMKFAFEMGFLRGHGEGLAAAGAMYDELRKKVDRE
jgi:hypothetical protein